MGRIRKGSIKYDKKRGAWVARLNWTDETGNRRERKRQVENKSAGDVLIKKWQRDLDERGAQYLDSEKITFKKLAEEFKQVRLIPAEYRDGKKVAGLRGYMEQRYRLKRLEAYFGERRIRSITAADVDRYRIQQLQTPTRLSKQKRTAADVNRSLSLLRTAFNFAIEKEWLVRNPFSQKKGLISPAQETARERVLSTDEQRKLLQACQKKSRKHIFPIVLVALDSGCRRGELFKLLWRDVDLEKGTLRVTSENAKSNRQRIIDLEPLTIVELRKLAKTSGAFPDVRVFGIKNTIKISFNGAMDDAEIKGARFHDLRATAITGWLVRGMSTVFAMRRSGHSDPRVFMRYVRMSEEVLQKQREQLREWELASSLAELVAESREEKQEYVN